MTLDLFQVVFGLIWNSERSHRVHDTWKTATHSDLCSSPLLAWRMVSVIDRSALEVPKLTPRSFRARKRGILPTMTHRPKRWPPPQPGTLFMKNVTKPLSGLSTIFGSARRCPRRNEGVHHQSTGAMVVDAADSGIDPSKNLSGFHSAWEALSSGVCRLV